jgi:predicted HTH domain antitoxin
MDPGSDCTYKGSNSNPTVDSERLKDLADVHYVVTLKLKTDAQINFRNFISLCKTAKQEAAQGSRKLRRKREENRKVLVELLLQSNLILQKAERLQEQTQLLLQDVSADIHDYPF